MNFAREDRGFLIMHAPHATGRGAREAAAGFRYDDSDIHLRYDEAQRLPPAVMAMWMDALGRCLAGRQVTAALDLGCGTGRFVTPLRDRFQARVVAIDPSWKMLRSAANSCGDGVLFVRARAENIPLADDCIDLVYMSVVWHLVEDKGSACREIGRVLRRGGSFCLRTPTVEGLDSELSMRFFPSALLLNRRRMPSRADLAESLAAFDLVPASHLVIRHPQSASLAEYIERVGLRALTDLASIPDTEFNEGMQRLRRYGAAAPEHKPFVDVDLFVFRNDASG